MTKGTTMLGLVGMALCSMLLMGLFFHNGTTEYHVKCWSNGGVVEKTGITNLSLKCIN